MDPDTPRARTRVNSTIVNIEMRYRAFISYSHADKKWAADLQKFLERYRVPRQLSAKIPGKQPLRPVFRDQTELTSGKLSDSINEALAESSALIVLCSPNARRSEWVGAEIEQFRDLHGDGRIFPLIVGGVAHAAEADQECFPKALRHGTEYLAADATSAAGKRGAFLRIAAALLEVGYDDLKQRDQNRRQVVFAGMAAGAVSIAIVTTVLAINAFLAQQEAELRRGQADDLIGFMVGDLRSKLEPIGRIDVLDEVGDRALAYLSSLPDGDDDRVLDQRAMTLRQIGEVRVAQGRFDEGLDAFSEALSIYQSLGNRVGNQPERLYQRALTHFWMADAHLRRLDHEAAEAEIVAYRDASRRLVEMVPENNDYWLELASAETNLGTLAYRRSQFGAARDRFVEAEAAAREIVAREPDNELFRSTLSGTVSWLGSAEIGLGNLQRGTDFHREVVAMGRASVARGDDMREKGYFATDLQVLSVGLHNFGQLDEAIEADDEALAILTELVAFDAENKRWARGLARGQSIASRHRISACRIEGVGRLLSDSRSTLERLIAIDPSNAATRIDIANNSIETARFAAIGGRLDEFMAQALDSNSRMATLFDERPDDVLIRRGVARSAAIVVAAHHASGRPDSIPGPVKLVIDELGALGIQDAEVSKWLNIIETFSNQQQVAAAVESGRYPRLVPECVQLERRESRK